MWKNIETNYEKKREFNMYFVNDYASDFKTTLDETKKEKRLGIHSFHRYYGKLIPAIPRAAIRKYTKKGDVVFDPFVGSGTTSVEAIYAERNFVGIEINPLSVMISRIKTSDYDLSVLKELEKKILLLIENDNSPVLDTEKPFCINREHWFKNFVQEDLIKIKRNIHPAVSFISQDEQKKYEDFLLGVLSAIVKQVSNADTAHVFPGISKRMRKLEIEGKNNVNVFGTFKRGLKKRIKYIEEFGHHSAIATIINGDSSTIDLSNYENSVDLIITNPPYISSVRYAETLKLELYWMGICKTVDEYLELSNSMIGNDHLKKAQYKEKNLTEYSFINEYIEQLYEVDPKQAEIVFEFFNHMECVIKKLHLILKPGKKLVMKISDSKIRKINIPTGSLLTQMAMENGFKVVDFFNDKINKNSRSLLTARNTYSDIILEDNIIIWEKN